MALGLNTESGGGDYADIVKYDARAGRMFRVDRSQDGGGQWQTNNVEITQGFQAVFDLDNIEVGWSLFASGVAPSFVLVPLGQPLPARPSDQHKQGFRVMVKLGKSSGGDVRELASVAKVVIGALDSLHTEFLAQRAKNPGKLPVVALSGVTAVVTTGKGQSSTNYAPVFEIKSWVDRPAEFDGQTAAASPPAQAPAQQPAKAAPAAAPAMADAEEF
ncbi:MAG: hypothetical protein ACEQSH_00895 [Bacteroidia bacterium]